MTGGAATRAAAGDSRGSRWARVAAGGRRPPAALAALCVLYVLLAALPAAPGSRLVLATVGGSPGWLLGPLAPLGIAAARGPAAGPVFYAGLWLALVLYALVVRAADRIPPRLAVAAIALATVAFFAAPPLLSQDAFSYISYARLGALHGLDPYAHVPAALPHDPAFAFAGSRGIRSSYGVLFTLPTYALAPLGVAAAYWLLKLAAAAAAAAIAWLVWRCAERRGSDPVRATLAVSLNPILLVHVVSAAHNDALAVALMLGGVCLALARRPAGGTALAAAAAFVKAPVGLVAPYLIAGARSGRWRALAAAVAAAAALAALTLVAFGGDALKALATIGRSQGTGSRLSVPHALAGLWPGGAGSSLVVVRTLLTAGFVVVAGTTLWRTWRGADPIAMAGWATLALLVASAWLVPWYLLWLLPLAALAGSRRLELATLAICGWSLAIAVPGVYR